MVALYLDMKPNGHLLLDGNGDVNNEHVKQEHVANSGGFVENVSYDLDMITIDAAFAFIFAP